MAFKLRSGNTTNFKSMGSSPAKQRLNKGGEGQDQDKIFKNGEHVGDWVNGKKVMHTNKGKDKEFNRMIREHEFDHEKIVRPKEKKVIHRDIDDRELDKKAEQNAANDKADKFHKRGKYAVKKKSPNKQKKSLVDPKTGLNQLEKAYTLNPSDETTRMMLAEYYKQSASKKATKKAVKGIKTAASKSKSKSKTTSKAAKALANLTVKGASNKQKK
jgi:hypothetical protein